MDPVLFALDRQFCSLDRRSREILGLLGDDQLFTKLPGFTAARYSCGELLLRSAAIVEMTFGGITTRLWDDPFEWTLPEKLSTHEAILDYLDEVEQTRKKGFGYFSSDSDLIRKIPAPQQLKPLIDILLDALRSSAHFQGRAYAVFGQLSSERLTNL